MFTMNVRYAVLHLLEGVSMFQISKMSQEGWVEETSSLGGHTRIGTNYSATLVHRHRKDTESESERFVLK
jgi:hypothetical protein